MKLRRHTPYEIRALGFIFQRDCHTDPQEDMAEAIHCNVICGGGELGAVWCQA